MYHVVSSMQSYMKCIMYSTNEKCKVSTSLFIPYLLPHLLTAYHKDFVLEIDYEVRSDKLKRCPFFPRFEPQKHLNVPKILAN